MKTLQNIRQYSNKLQKLVEYSISYRENNLNNYDKSYSLYQMKSSKKDIIVAFDKDIKITADNIIKIFPILASEKDGILKEFDGEDNSLNGVFGKLYNQKDNTVNISGITFNLEDIKSGNIKKADIVEKMVSNLFDVSITSYKTTISNLDKFDKAEGMEKVILSSVKKDADKIFNKIDTMIGDYQEKLSSLNIEDRTIIDKDITFSRTMIDGVIQNSTYISHDKGVEQISSKHKNDADMIKEFIDNSSYVDSIEMEKETDPKKVINVLNQLEQFNLNTTSKFTFKSRLLGNYGANGMYIPFNNIVSVDPRSPSSLIHEITHMIDYTTKQNVDNRNRIIKKYSQKLDIPDELKSEEEYYRNPEEVIARLGEIAFKFEVEDNNIEIDHDNDIEIIHTEEHYNKLKGVYFNYDEFTPEERKEVKNFFHSFYRIDKNLDIENNVDNYTKIDTNYTSINKGEKEAKTPMDKLLKEMKNYKKLFNNINKDNIEDILKYNKEENIVTDKYIIEQIINNIDSIGKHKQSMGVEEWREMVKDRSSVIDAVTKYGMENDENYITYRSLQKKEEYISRNIFMEQYKSFFKKVEENLEEENFSNHKTTVEDKLFSIVPNLKKEEVIKLVKKDNFDSYFSDLSEDLKNDKDVVNIFIKNNVFVIKEANENVLLEIQKDYPDTFKEILLSGNIYPYYTHHKKEDGDEENVMFNFIPKSIIDENFSKKKFLIKAINKSDIAVQFGGIKSDYFKDYITADLIHSIMEKEKYTDERKLIGKIIEITSDEEKEKLMKETDFIKSLIMNNDIISDKLLRNLPQEIKDDQDIMNKVVDTNIRYVQNFPELQSNKEFCIESMYKSSDILHYFDEDVQKDKNVVDHYISNDGSFSKIDYFSKDKEVINKYLKHTDDYYDRKNIVQSISKDFKNDERLMLEFLNIDKEKVSRRDFKLLRDSVVDFVEDEELKKTLGSLTKAKVGPYIERIEEMGIKRKYQYEKEKLDKEFKSKEPKTTQETKQKSETPKPQINGQFKSFKHIKNYILKRGYDESSIVFTEDKITGINSLSYDGVVLGEYHNKEQDYAKKKRFHYDREQLNNLLENGIEIDKNKSKLSKEQEEEFKKLSKANDEVKNNLDNENENGIGYQGSLF